MENGDGEWLGILARVGLSRGKTRGKTDMEVSFKKEPAKSVGTGVCRYGLVSCAESVKSNILPAILRYPEVQRRGLLHSKGSKVLAAYRGLEFGVNERHYAYPPCLWKLGS
jgi:hypothetical protein